MKEIEKLKMLGAERVEVTLSPETDTLKSTMLKGLPKSYLEALEYFVGDVEFSGFVVYRPITPNARTMPDGNDMVDYLFGLTSGYPAGGVFEILEKYQNRLPRGAIPFGSAPGGDLICFDTSNSPCSITLWNHELEGKGDGELCKIANTFEEFIDAMRFDNNDEPSNNGVEIRLDF